MTLTHDGEYCRQKAAVAGTSFYYSTLYYPPEVKRDLNALHAFAREIDDIPAECSDPGIARVKLVWWQEEVQRLSTQTARHPVTRELAQVANRHPPTASDIIALIRYHELRLEPEWPETYYGLLHFMEHGPGTIWRCTASLCGIRSNTTPDIASRMGGLFALFYYLQDRGPAWQPRDPYNTLMVSGQSAAEIFNQLIADLEHSAGQIAAEDRHAQLCLLIMARIIIATCHEIAHDGYRFRNLKTSLTPLRKLWIAWRTHRQVMRDE